MDLTDTEQELVRRGLAAADLLASDAFQSCIREIGIDCFAAFTESKPPEAAAREDTYNLYRGLQAIEAQLSFRVQQHEEIVRRLDESNALEVPDEEYSDEIIYLQGD